MTETTPAKLYALGTISEDRLVHMGVNLENDVLTVGDTNIQLGQKNELTRAEFIALKDHLKGVLHVDDLPVQAQLGGVAANVAEDFLVIADLLGLQAEATVCGPLGADANNSKKKFAETELGKIDGLRVYNSASDDVNFKTPSIHHFIERSGRRTGVIIKGEPLTADFSGAAAVSTIVGQFAHGSAKPINHYTHIGKDAATHHVAVITSRLPKISHVLAESSTTNNVHLVLDLNEDVASFIRSPEVTKIIQSADDIVTPVETFDLEDGEALADYFLSLVKGNFAISDAGNPVIIYENGVRQPDYTPPALTSDSRDVLGCGDMRTAVVALLRTYGIGFADSVRAATAISSYTANYLGKDWMDPNNARGILKLPDVQAVLRILCDNDITEPAPAIF